MADPKEPNVFLTWSGERSGAVARALRDWLRQVVQQSRPWMSERDIHAGKRWRGEIKRQLDTIRVGVLCLTPENVAKPWVNFEAGALSRSVDDDSRVIPYCFGLKPTDYADPLGDFHGVEADQAGALKLVESINAAMPEPIPDGDLVKVFERAYPDLDSALGKIPARVSGAPAKRETADYLDETLLRLRRMEGGLYRLGQAVGSEDQALRIGTAVDRTVQIFGEAFRESIAEQARQPARFPKKKEKK
jgi:hypothetical protein